MIRRNGYLVEEYAGELESLRRLELGIQSESSLGIEDLEARGLSKEEIKKLIMEAE